QLPYSWYGQQYNAAGTYTTTVPSTTGGCDTTATLNLTVNNLLTRTDDITICTTQLPYSWYGQQYNAGGTYTTTVPSTTGGCDTTATLNLAVNNLLTKTDNITICINKLPYSWYGQQYNAAGTYTTTVPSTTGGCDTTATLNLTVNPVVTSTTDTTVCQSALPFDWNGQSITAAGTYTANLASASGCDSIATLNVIVNPVVTSTTDTTVCQSVLPFDWNSQSITAAGIYTANLTSAAGCDSVATLNVIVNSVVTSTTDIAVCQ